MAHLKSERVGLVGDGDHVDPANYIEEKGGEYSVGFTPVSENGSVGNDSEYPFSATNANGYVIIINMNGTVVEDVAYYNKDPGPTSITNINCLCCKFVWENGDLTVEIVDNF
ncbi:hypothetical protein OUZ56_012060 [Daphnia magna]|uniref:Uncharacterized protein n=1 Tax=Daphnia magna TaxID=35525 RepID=A0ABQ9Z285_9CRUS|nr:hypothetical protein OUZ56_012060 [Daphnia magna]